jgi:outer membrane protein W
MNSYTCQLPGKCLSSFCGATAVACLLLAAASSAFAQRISVGIKAGVPLTDLVRTNSGDVPTSTQTKRYTIGPVVDIGLPLGFGVELGAMYKRFDQQSIAVTITGYVVIDEDNSYAITQAAGTSAVGHSWEFPVAAQYHFFKSAIRPYVEGGVSFNRLSNAYTVQIPYPRQPPQLPFTIEHMRSSLTRVGPLFGVGVDVKVHGIHVTPGLRYTHYNQLEQLTGCASGSACRGNTAVDILVGVTF